MRQLSKDYFWREIKGLRRKRGFSGLDRTLPVVRLDGEKEDSGSEARRHGFRNLYPLLV
jgi:hypothetical protein